MSEDSTYFKTSAADGSRRHVDFVLVWEEEPEDAKYNDHVAKRKTYLKELLEAGLECEEDEDTRGIALRFMKLHVPLEVLKQYAEILKLRMVLKASLRDKELENLARGVEGMDLMDLEFKLTQDSATAGDSHYISLPGAKSQAQGTLQIWLDWLQKPLYPQMDDRYQGHHYTATYSRDKDYLFDDDKAKFFSPAARSRIMEFILTGNRFLPEGGDDFAFGMTRLLSEGVYLAAYPLHDGTKDTPGSQRQLLSQEWASLAKWWKYQPLDAIRDYYGVKMGLYFAWLGFYTAMLIPPSLVGIFCFLYGLATYTADTISQDICEGPQASLTMCPVCDTFCDNWSLDTACGMTRAKYMFDNVTTVFFAVFMSLWAVVFLELWKRYSAEICHRWDVYGYDPEEEHPRPEYLEQLRGVKQEHWTQNYVTREREPKPPFWRMKVPGVLISWTSVFMMISLAGITVLGVILYRMSMVVALAAVSDNTIRSNYSLFISITGASINLVLILVFNYFYELLAFWLTEKELHRTQTNFDDSLTVKIYLFQFVNYYASIFYIAFFKGQFLGTPAKYNRFLGYRQEECAPGGCFMELTIQLAIIFVGKQFFLSVLEYYMPLIWKLMNLMKLAGIITRKEEDGTEVQTPQHIRDFKLVEWGRQGLFYEYLEMVIQYGFITIFVCAFPLAPFFALCNNVLELRLDAKKILELHRRPIAQKVRSIGVWFDILETVGRISIITNALIIALTSEFIPKLVYKYFYSEDGSMEGYVDFSLSTFSLADMDPQTLAHHETKTGEPRDWGNITECRYPDYNWGPGSKDQYQPNTVFWHIWFARLLFVVVFENVLAVALMAIKLCIPDVSSALKHRIRRETFITTKLIMDREKEVQRGKHRQDRAGEDQAPLGRTSEVDLEFPQPGTPEKGEGADKV